ncbi:MAG: carboxynorspermidine decarboxylase [Paludibacter sp.]|jgi:carboxynorspermidine decarboxylase|nr:carboxynorspermidine decarboxylase [Paludibacter sp.]
MINYSTIPSPCYVLDEQALRQNLEIIRSVKEQAQVEIILAFKAFALWRVFPVFHEYGFCLSTASSLSEARLAVEKMQSKAHTYAPVYSDSEFAQIADCSSHITFNSLSQFERFYPATQSEFHKISCGLRINPEVSVVDTDLYNPASKGSRLGIIAANLPEKLPQNIEGLHFHALCESSSYDLEKVLSAVETKFGKYFSQIRWLNMGGGHLMTRKDYDRQHLIAILKNFKARYPHLQIILEPGAAFVWQTGVLAATVEDIVENYGIRTAILNVSFACNMPDCLEMPYQPEVLYAKKQQSTNTDYGNNFVFATKNSDNSQFVYRLGGNSCLSGDFIGDWTFERPLATGDKIIFADMIHYTTVKTTMFNGVSHPAIGIWTAKDEFQFLRQFEYSDYRDRMC